MFLTNYGFQTEQSHLRAHVSIAAKTIYLFQTEMGRRAIRTGKFRIVSVWLGGENTAQGYLVPPSAIPECVSIPIPDELLKELPIKPTDLVTVKGAKAEEYVRRLIGGELVTNRASQFAGIDLWVGPIGIQVKCDFNAGEGGTGNLFLQVAEYNVHQNW